MREFKVPFLDLTRGYAKHQEEIEKAVLQVLRSGIYIMGHHHEALEKQMAEDLHVKHAMAVSSGTAGLLLALMYYNIQEGDDVLTSPFSFFATTEVIALLGARPLFADIDPDTFNISTALLSRILNEALPRLKGLLIPNMFGQCAQWDDLHQMIEDRDLFLIEDACQSLGSTYRTRPSGTLADIGVVSFYPSKPFNTLGEGGMIFTDNDEMAQKIRYLRNHGDMGGYQHQYIGFNARLNEIQCAILNVKWKYYQEDVIKRSQKAQYYHTYLKDWVQVPQIQPENRSVYSLYTIKTFDDSRDQLQAHLEKQGIPTRVYYPLPIPLQPALNNLADRPGDYPSCEEVCSKVLSIPFFTEIHQNEQEMVVQAIRSFYE